MILSRHVSQQREWEAPQPEHSPGMSPHIVHQEEQQGIAPSQRAVEIEYRDPAFSGCF
jgi:hypothetical protein